ncbi:hypothetical protein ACIBI3_18055 [Actinomadura luteofluorescens]|uniref:hypothetical protein n=1 Tax=Actinomadura luteofluorescens TaxID=46163 RepID=UPI003496A982
MPAQRLVQGEPPAREPILLVHQVSGTFLQSENQSTATLNDEVQNENHWPLPSDKTVQWRLYEIRLRGGRSVYLMEHQVNEHVLTFRPGSGPGSVPGLSPILTAREGRTGSPLQHWRFVPVPGTGANYWGIVPDQYPGYALGLYNNHVADDQWVVPTPTWGGPPTLFHAWSAVPTTIPAGDVDEEDAWLVGEDEGVTPEPRTNM